MLEVANIPTGLTKVQQYVGFQILENCGRNYNYLRFSVNRFGGPKYSYWIGNYRKHAEDLEFFGNVD